jgi:hypothetical protein
MAGCEEMEMRKRGWRIGFLNTPAVVRNTLSSVNLCVSSQDVDRFYVIWNEKLVHSFHGFWLPVMACSLQKVEDFKRVHKIAKSYY